MLSKIIKVISLIKNDPKTFLIIIVGKLSILFSDKTYVKLMYRLKVGKQLRLDNPITFN